MKVKWTNVSDARGKLAGMVASKNRSGNFLRAKVTPINRQSSAQLGIRAVLAFFSAAWAAILNESQRLAWDSMAVNYPKTNVFGDAYTPTGKNLFTALNANSRLVDGPSTIVEPPLPENIPFPNLVVSNTTAAAWNINGFALQSSLEYLIRATRPLSQGTNFFKGKYKVVGFVNGAAPLNAVLNPTDYALLFGAPQVGQKIAVQVVAVNQATGNVSLPVETSFIVT